MNAFGIIMTVIAGILALVFAFHVSTIEQTFGRNAAVSTASAPQNAGSVMSTNVFNNIGIWILILFVMLVSVSIVLWSRSS